MTDAASGRRIPSGPDRHSGVGALFAPGGAIARTLGGTFEPRPGQARMAEAVSDAIAGEQVLLVEAGTGTGKTFAYIAPGLMARKRMVIATGTRALQDQLVGKDLPQITTALGPARPRGREPEGRQQLPVQIQIRPAPHRPTGT